MNNALKSMIKNRVLIVLILIVILAFVLRVWNLGESNMWVDEAISSVAAREILDKGIPKFDSGAFYGRALVFHYLMAFFILILGGDFGARLISILFGVGSVVLAFFISREFIDDEKKNKEKFKNFSNSNLDDANIGVFKPNRNNAAGLIAALFCAVLFLEIAYSRQARFYQMFQFLFFLSLFFLYKSKDDKKYAWMASISLIILVDTHLAGLVVVPLFLYFFIKEQKDWKLFIIPIVLSLYYGPSVLGIGTGNGQIISNYVENYSSSLFYYLRAFAIITLIGLPFAFYWNKRLTSVLVIPSAVLLFSLIFVKVYALRYAYFIVLITPLFISVLFYYIYRSNKWFFAAALIFAVIYPSNLFFDSGNMTVVEPENIQLRTFSEPIIGYKDLSSSLKEEIMSSGNIVLFTPAFSWYYKNPDYFIPFSLNGLPTGYSLYNGADVYTGAKRFDIERNKFEGFIFVEDAFGYSKLSKEERERVDDLKKECYLIEEARLLKVYRC